MAEKRKFRTVNFRMRMFSPDGKDCINKAHLIHNEDGTIDGDFTMMFSDEPKFWEKFDKKWHDNGFVKQQVNKATREAEKQLPNEQKTNLPILGSCREYIKTGNASGVPGMETQGVVTDAEAINQMNSGLPF